MRKTFKAEKISCQKCADTIKLSLGNDFGDIDFDFSKDPSEITVFIKDEEHEEKFKNDMSELGYEVTP